MKELIALILSRGWLLVSALAACGSIYAAQSVADAGAVEFHVKPGGVEPFTSSDPAVRPQLGKPGKPKWATGGIEPGYWLSGGGSADRPFSTLYQAQLAVRELLRTKGMPGGGIRVIVHGGLYRLTQTVEFIPQDSGKPGNPVVYSAAPGEKPVFSGGLPVTGWTRLETVPLGLPSAAVGHVWVARAPEVDAATLDFRQLYLNGRKAVRARAPNGDNLHHLVEWDAVNRQAVVDASEVGEWRNLKRVEMFLQQSWVVSTLRVESIAVEGARARITFQQPERDIVFSHPYPWPRNTDPFYFVNALEFLDEPGEWYLDYKAGLVYYWPRADEDMTTAQVVAPHLETLVRFQGSMDRPVHDIEFKGLSFEDSTWMRPTQEGNVPLQLGQYFEQPAYRIEGGVPEFAGLDNLGWTGRPPAAVYVTGASGIIFERCRFRNTASAALDLHYATRNNQIIGCVFHRIGGNGVQIGRFSEQGLEAHLPYRVSDERELSLNDRVANSYFRDCGNEDWGSTAIAAGFPRGLTIEHNEVVDMPYSGISVGWGWTTLENAMRDNKILYNRIHDYMTRMGDGGGIYTLSNQTPSEIRGNYIYDLRRSASGDPSSMIYLDEGSSGFLVRDNLTETNVFFKNRNGEGNHWENTGTVGPQELKTPPGTQGYAGLEAAFLDLIE
jgi:hypothetical protein